MIAQIYGNDGLQNSAPADDAYHSLQHNWREEIKAMFDELKCVEQQIREREQGVIQCSIEQNEKRLKLTQWEEELRARELHLIEYELKLFMSKNDQERAHKQHTPKVHKRSGGFMRALLFATMNGTAALSSTTANHLISGPTGSSNAQTNRIDFVYL